VGRMRDESYRDAHFGQSFFLYKYTNGFAAKS